MGDEAIANLFLFSLQQVKNGFDLILNKKIKLFGVKEKPASLNKEQPFSR